MNEAQKFLKKNDCSDFLISKGISDPKNLIYVSDIMTLFLKHKATEQAGASEPPAKPSAT